MTLSVRLRDFEAVVFFTGAGMSAESGVPTYRGKGGIWKEYDYEEYACQPAFERQPEAVWEFHNYRRGIVSQCAPNAGHALIARLEKELPHVSVITQNIDGLHQKAGSENVVELHGSLWRIRCDMCNHKRDSHDVPLTELRCECGRFWRPDIVWFGDALGQTSLTDARRELKACTLLVSVGTSSVVYPAAEMPLIAKHAGATLVEINPEPTPLSHAYDVCLRGHAGEMLAELAG